MMSVGIGLSVSNSRAVIEALLGIQTSFKRTPKYCIESANDRPAPKTKYRRKSGYTPYLELILGVYFAITVFYAFSNENYLTLPFLMLFVGFLLHGRDVAVSESFRALPWSQDPPPIDWEFGKIRRAGFPAAP
jgi:hypothetical protein